MLLSNITFGQESFNLNSGASTASNDGNFCGRVKFDVVNSNSFAVDVDINWDNLYYFCKSNS